MHKLHLLVYGLFGGYNFGDELFSKVIVEEINKRDTFANPYLFTKNAENSNHNVNGFHPLLGFPLPKKGFQDWRKALRAYRKSDGLLFGGGGLFNEVFLRAGIPAKGIILATAKAYQIPYVLHGLEIGYVKSPLNRFVTKWALRNAHRVICRNESSLERARQLYGTEVDFGVDINQGWLNDQLRESTDPQEAALKPNRKVVINLQQSLVVEDDQVQQVIQGYRDQGYQAIFLVNNKREQGVVKARFAKGEEAIILALTVQETIEVLQEGDAFIAERFHYTMAALHANRPTTIFVSSTKVREMLDELAKQGSTVNVLREEAGKRSILEIPPSAARATLTEHWGQRATTQLTGVLDGFTIADKEKITGLSISSAFMAVLFYAIFAIQYLLDKYRPLQRQLDLSKT